MEGLKSVPEYLDYMMGHPELKTCPIRRTLEVVGGKWKIFIVLQLFRAERLRFGQLAGQVEGITNTMLSNCLRELEADSIVERRQYNEMPLRVEYRLTGLGRTLAPVLLALADWGLRHPAEKTTP